MNQNHFNFIFKENPSPEEVRCIQEGLQEYNRAYAPEDYSQPLNIFIRTTPGKIVGGLLGITYWGWLYVSYLWLDENVRRQGLGERLLSMAEEEAIRRGCHHAHLETMSFQALHFYQKHGYTVFGELHDLPTGHSRIFLKKDLQASS